MKRSIADSTAPIPKAQCEHLPLESRHIQVTGRRHNQENRDKEREEENVAEGEKEEEVELIKSKKPKMRVIKPTEIFVFSFHWENPEDILRDLDIMNQEDVQSRTMTV